jgi:RNA polymerase sigma-70 factor, ECF subfamily
VQETFLRAWRALDRFDETRPFAPWLLRIATNWSRTQLETRKRRGGEELGDDLAWSGPSPDEDAEKRQLRDGVNRAVAQLPREQRVVLHLRVVEGMSYREIADTLEMPIGTVMSRLARAREILRGKVER